MKEKWRNIGGYVGYYQASNKGRIKSLTRISVTKKRTLRLKGRIMKQQGCNSGYKTVMLAKDWD